LKGGSAFCFRQVDIGAGVGFFSLAAAARGHRSLAFETSPKHLRALRTSVARNRFQELITVRPVQVGASSPSFCATWNMRVEVRARFPHRPLSRSGRVRCVGCRDVGSAPPDGACRPAAPRQKTTSGWLWSGCSRAHWRILSWQVENLLAEDIGDITTGGFSAAMLDGVVSMFGAEDARATEGAGVGAQELDADLPIGAAGVASCTLTEGVTTLDVALPPDLDVGAIRISADGLEVRAHRLILRPSAFPCCAFEVPA